MKHDFSFANSFCLIVIFLTFPIFIFSQQKQDYIKKDGNIIYGTVVTGQGFKPTEIFFKEKEGSLELKFESNEISEFYLYLLDKTFLSKKIKGEGAFFFEKGKGEKEGLWILRESGTTKEYKDYGLDYVFEVSRRGLIKNASKEDLQKISQEKCSSKNINYKVAKNNKRKLKRILVADKGCIEERIRFFKIGLQAGLDASTYRNTFFAQGSDIATSWHLGVWTEVPFNIMGNISVVTGLDWNSFAYSNSGLPYTDRIIIGRTLEKIEHEYQVAMTSIELPLLVRYHISNNKFAPFANIGMSYSFYYQKEDRIYEINVSGNNGKDISIDQLWDDEDYLYDRGLNILAGVGGQYFLTDRIVASMELRYFQNVNNTSFENQLKRKGLELIIGLGF